jgi:signal transduction histidine kinase
MIEDYEAWEGRSPKFQASDIGRILAIPMQVGERLIGVLNIADSKTGSYGEDDIRLASLFADQAAIAIEGARLVDETTRRAAYLEALTNTAAALRAAVTPHEMYADVLGQVVDQLRAEGATLALMDPESGETQAVLAVGVWQGTTGMRLSRGRGIIGMVTSSGQAFVSDDVRGDARLARPELLRDLPAIACVPLTVEDQIVGCVMVGRREPLSAEEVQLLTGLAEIAGNAIYRAGVMATLEARVDQRTQELEAANRELEAFAYSVSHDLRAPLRAMHGFSTALLSDSQGQLDEQGRHYLDRIGAAAKHMGELIDALLDLSRIARREMRQQPVDLSVLAREVASQLQTQDEGRRVEWVIPDELPAQGDAHLLSLALQNLMGNAWKFTGPRPQARIEVGALPRTSPATAPGSGKEEGGLVYFVRDNGVGFDMAYADKLFAPFQRLHGMSEFPGTGIGLATVQRIIARHGGRIWAEAEVDRGATFFFTLERA